MKTVSVMVDIPVGDLMRIAKQELGMEPVAPIPDAAMDPSFYRRTVATNSAIQHVIRATEKFDRDQYSPGEGSATTALFEAAKRLRKAFNEETSAKSIKGKFHV